MKKVICKNIIIGDGYCSTCKHSKPHVHDDESCGNDCPYDLAIDQECIECETPVICVNAMTCQYYKCPHIVIHEYKETCKTYSCPISKQYVFCINIETGGRM